MFWTIYLSGEIHTDWREQIAKGCRDANLQVEFRGPVTDHAASDDAGDVLGPESTPFWKDHKSAKINSIRTRTLIAQSDLAIIRFGDKFKQWNAAFDAGLAAAAEVPYITLHDEALIHPLKEVDAAAMAWASTPTQVVEILKYVTQEA
jgi:YtoQ family protein